MADKKEGGTDIIRIIGFAILGTFLVIVGFVARGLTDESTVTDAPSNWLGPSFTGTVVAYEAGQTLTVQGEDSQWICAVEKGSQISSSTGEPLVVGALVQIKYRGGDKPVAKNIRVIKNSAKATATPGEGSTPSGIQTPTEQATPGGTQTPAEQATPAGT